MTCKSIGMKMASIETAAELRNLQRIALKNSVLFKNQIYLNGKKLTATQTPTSCLSFLKRPKEKLEIKVVDCNSEPKKFLCERVEVVDTYEDEFEVEAEDKVEVKKTFFNHLGDYGNRVDYVE